MPHPPSSSSSSEAERAVRGCECPSCRHGKQHASDCAVHNMPAMPNGPCDCGQESERIDLAALARKHGIVTGLGGATDVLNFAIELQQLLTTPPILPILPIDFKQASERVYLVATGEIHEGQETYTRHDVRPPLCDAETLYTHPAPKQASEQGGWQSAPTGRPTDDMVKAGMKRMFDEKRYHAPWDDVIALMFMDMVKAAPKSAHPEEGALLLGGDVGGKAGGGA